jgi:predicted membrane protein
MSFFTSATFWGVIILLIGLSIILRELFHINIPFLRIVFGVILIYWGIRIISGGFGRSWNRNSAVFSEAKMKYDDRQREYNIIFGNGVVDLFKMEEPAENKKVEMNVVFGNGSLILNDSIPVKVKMQAAFGSVQAPNKSANGFGETVFTTSSFNENAPYTLVDASAVFGKIEIESKKW